MADNRVVAKTLDDLLRERPGDPERRARFKAEMLEREKSLLYVAATRARDELVILWAGDPSELLPSAATDGP